MGGDDYYGGDYLQDIIEVALLEIGGQRLLDQASAAAGAYVDVAYPWNGLGDEPPARISAYLGVLWQWTEYPRGP